MLLDYSLVTELEERALRREGNGSVPGSGPQTELVKRTPGKNGSAEASTKDALKLFVFVPSLLQARPSSDTVSRLFPLTREYSRTPTPRGPKPLTRE